MKSIFKKFTALLMIFALLLSLAACGGSEESGSSNGENGDTFVFCDADNSSVKKLGNVKNKLNAQEIYNKLDYIPEMFYGEYGMETYDKKFPDKIEKFQKEMDYKELKINEEPVTVSSLPFEFAAGKATNHTIAHIPGFHWMRLSFYTEDGNLKELWAAYSIDGNKIKLNWLKEYEYIEEKHVAKYLLSDIITEYTFKFSGTELTLSDGSKSVTLTAKAAIENDFSIEAHLVSGTEPIDDIEIIHLDASLEKGSEDSFAKIDFTLKDGEEYRDSTYNVYGEATKDGLLTISYQKETESDGEEEAPVITHQFVYFLTGSQTVGNMILTDGEKVYMYCNDDKKTTADGLGGEEIDLSALSDEEIAKLNTKKDNLLEDLVKAFEAKGITVAVNKQTGEIAMDSSVLFGGDSSVL